LVLALPRSRAILAQALVHQGHDLVERIGLAPLFAGDAPDQAIDTLDVLGAAK
jgi:hypothetical protein